MEDGNIKKKIYDIMKSNQFAVMATVSEDGKPWARYIACKASEDLTVRFATYASSRKISHIKNNPEVHFTMGSEAKGYMSAYLQIQGLAEINDSKEEKESFWSESCKYYFKDQSDPEYVVVKIKPYLIEYWHNAREPEILDLRNS